MTVRCSRFHDFSADGQTSGILLFCILGLFIWLSACTAGPTAVQDRDEAFLDMMVPHEETSPETLHAELRGELPSIEDIVFSRGGHGELKVTLETLQDIRWRRLPSGPGRVHYVFPGQDVPASLAKVYQLHEFSHPVKNALLRNSPEGAELIVNATGPVHVDLFGQAGRLDLLFTIDFEALDGRGLAPDMTMATVPAVRARGPEQPAALLDDDQEELPDSGTIFPGMRQEYAGEPISIDVQNIEVEHILRLISEIAGYNLILDPEVSGKISMKLDNVPWDQVLDLVLVQKGLGKVRVGNILRISTIQRLSAESKMISDARAEAARARIVEQELEPLQTTFIQVNYSTAAEMDSRLRPFLTRDRGTMSHDPRTNMLIVTDVPANIRKIRGVVERLDRPERQVLIEARVVYATENFQRGIGIQWGGGIEGITTEYWRGLYGFAGGEPAPIDQGGIAATGYLVNAPFAGETTFGIGGFISKLMGPDMFTLDAKLQLGEMQGESRTVSSPRIVTLNNNSAEIEQGMSMAIQVPDERGTRTDYVDAVLKLTVQPQITPDDNLILDLFVSDDTAQAGGNIEKKQANTKLLVENGQIIVLGGVLKTTERLDERRVPGVAEVPLLGWLFKNRLTRQEKQELLIFIRPTIL